MGTIVPNPVSVNLEVSWLAGGPSWVDQQPWPPYAATPIAVDPAQPISPVSFSLTGNNGTNPAPVPGQSIAMFDRANLTFHQKVILTATAVGTDWLIVVDTTTGESDTSYVPFGGQIVSPWSANLQSLLLPVVGYLDTLGPGEQLADADFVDPGLRQRRSPANPQSFPSEVGNRLISPLFGLPSVADVVLLSPAIPYDPPVGAPGVSAYLTTLQNLAVFVEPS